MTTAVFKSVFTDHHGMMDEYLYHYVCRCGEKWPALPEDYDAEIALHAAHVEAELASAGVAVVELARASEDSDGQLWFDTPEIRVDLSGDRPEAWRGEHQVISPGVLRLEASELLAAAKALTQ